MSQWLAQKKLMEKKREEMIIKFQALLRGWLVRRNYQQQKAAVIRFQAGNIIPLAYTHTHMHLTLLAIRGFLARCKFAKEKLAQQKRVQQIILLQAGMSTCISY